MTLIEMLTVLFVVSILVAFVTGTARYASRSAETRRAQADLQLLADALERYYLRFGEYPPAGPDASDDPGNRGKPDARFPATTPLKDTRSLPGQSGQYYDFSNSLPRSFTGADPWGNRYQYVTNGNSSADNNLPETFTIYSLGPDGKLEPDQGAPDDNIHL